jgi:transcriptional regulator with XRE-family HTH domain
MARRISRLLPSTEALLRSLGERLRIARLRRRLQAKQLAERAGMAVMTLRALERGSPGVTIEAYTAVLQVLSLERDLEAVAANDRLGRSLQDAGSPLKPRRAPRKKPSTEAAASPAHAGGAPDERASAKTEGGLTTEDLLRLLKP